MESLGGSHRVARPGGQFWVCTNFIHRSRSATEVLSMTRPGGSCPECRRHTDAQEHIITHMELCFTPSSSIDRPLRHTRHLCRNTVWDCSCWTGRHTPSLPHCRPSPRHPLIEVLPLPVWPVWHDSIRMTAYAISVRSYGNANKCEWLIMASDSSLNKSNNIRLMLLVIELNQLNRFRFYYTCLIQYRTNWTTLASIAIIIVIKD